ARSSGQLVLVAASTSGLGRAVSLAFLEQGAKVVVTYRNQKEFDTLEPSVPHCECHRNFCSASVVSLGRSSSNQCPVSFSTTTVTFEATSFICCASASPSAFSPPITSTGMVSLA